MSNDQNSNRAPSGALAIGHDRKMTRRSWKEQGTSDVLVLQRWPLRLGLPIAATVIYGTLVDLVNADKGYAFPSVPKLGKLAGMKRTATNDAIALLCQMALIEKVADVNPNSGKQRANRYYVLEHPADPTYRPAISHSRASAWTWIDLVDFAHRAHGLPSDWDDRQHRAAQATREKLAPVAERIDVEVTVKELNELLPSTWSKTGKRPSLYGHPRPTTEESDELLVPALHVIADGY